MDNCILKVDNVNKRYKYNNVLEDISFSVNKGEFLSLLGPSGCGKTTMLRIIIGIEKPTTGRIYKQDVDITDFSPKDRNMGIVFQS